MKYTISMRLIHWFMAICLVGLVASGLYMANLDSSAPNKYALYPLHKSFGVLMLVMIVVRFSSMIPALPKTIPVYEKIAAHIVHFGLYALMIALPVSGYLMSDFGGFPVKFFGIELFDFFATNKDIAKIFYAIHHYAPWAFMGFLFLHIVGAIRHRYFDKKENDILNRML